MPHPTLRRTLLLSLLTAATAASVAAPAQAAGPFEPNDSFATAATGPFEIASHASNGASLETSDDIDVYKLDLSSLPAGDQEIGIDVVTTQPLGVTRCLNARTLRSDGTAIQNGSVHPVPCDPVQSGDIQFVRPADDIVYLEIRAAAISDPAPYAFSVYSGAQVFDNLGFAATLSGEGADDNQRVYVNAEGLRQRDDLIGEANGTEIRKLGLGIHFGQDRSSQNSTFTFESRSADNTWSWDWTLTNRTYDYWSGERSFKTLLREKHSGISLVPIENGLVRRVTVDAAGTVLGSRCADGVIAVPCGNAPKTDYPTYPVVTPKPAPVATGPVATPAALPKPGAIPPVPKPAPAAIALAGSFKVSGKGKTIKGKLSAANPVCVASAKVSLVQKAAKPKKGKKAKKDKTLGSTRSKADGSWTIKLKKAAKGKTYVKVTPAAKNAAACASGQSKTKTL